MNEILNHPSRPSRLWLWFVGMFVVQALVWAGWITLAHHHPVEEVPLAGAADSRR